MLSSNKVEDENEIDFLSVNELSQGRSGTTVQLCLLETGNICIWFIGTVIIFLKSMFLIINFLVKL